MHVVEVASLSPLPSLPSLVVLAGLAERPGTRNMRVQKSLQITSRTNTDTQLIYMGHMHAHAHNQAGFSTTPTRDDDVGYQRDRPSVNGLNCPKANQHYITDSLIALCRSSLIIFLHFFCPFALLCLFLLLNLGEVISVGVGHIPIANGRMTCLVARELPGYRSKDYGAVK